MKKILPFILLAGIGFLSYSCDNKDDVVVQQNANFQMKDITGTFTGANNANFTISQGLGLKSTDVLLVYRNINSNSGGSTIWQQIPKTYFLTNNRELDYNFLFNSQNVDISTKANFDQTTMTAAEANTYLNNQTFRLVIVPANTTGTSNKSAKAPVDYSDYNAVVKYYNLNDSNVPSVRVN
ncbi:hypothetical protein C1637_24835 [Chryseobacterium lactis]|uniref:DUF1735 domain-containing protein n=1 Tax=Chryseobacterium lactis TaxID=1241981 RepID=A0A3G6RPY4_CHRLC|nr:hypothetical protein [Chryseobacterium lactis]AZA81954.1 hypothetical protein EG342_08555 [Chryseobacterium lactis]AZB06952.1 hypothetical protein EG341_24670 [Chryseobacterium lactis]PNW11002.1 hypothetical protein C1637_24835 [Chryseobacterium lactis]